MGWIRGKKGQGEVVVSVEQTADRGAAQRQRGAPVPNCS